MKAVNLHADHAHGSWCAPNPKGTKMLLCPYTAVLHLLLLQAEQLTFPA